MNKFSRSEILKIILLLPDHIGDAIFTLPAIESIKEVFPKAKIDILVNILAAPLFENDPRIHRIIPINPDWEELWFKHRFYRSQHPSILRRLIVYPLPFIPLILSNIFKQIRSDKYSMAINFNGNFFTNYLTYLTLARIRLSFGTFPGNMFLTHTIPSDTKIKHRIESCLEIAKFLGGDNKKVNIFLEKKDNLFAEKIINKFGVSKNNIIAIHPGASKIARFRALKVNQWIEILNRLSSNYNIIILGGSEEEDMVEQLFPELSLKHKYINLAGKTSLKQLVSIIRMSDLLIGLNSASIHIAASVNTPVIAIWDNLSDPRIWGPFTRSKIIIKNNRNDDPRIDEIIYSVKKLLTSSVRKL